MGFLHRFGLFFITAACVGQAAALSVLTYNVAGNGTTDWSTNAPQVQAIGRQMRHLQPDVITFNEVPYTNSWQMTNFVAAYLPGYALAANSGTDGFLRSVIMSRHPIVRSQKWLDGVSLAAFGYTNGNFTRDLFEAEIAVPGYGQHLHVFTSHLKALSDSESAQRRGAEASAISNFFVNTFLPGKGQRPYLLTGDLNEDVAKPPSTSRQPIARLANAATGLQLTTPLNPITRSERTFSIRASLSERIDYIMPGALLFTNLTNSLVFRTDQLTPLPGDLLGTDSRTASDHLPVLLQFRNPYDVPFRITSWSVSNGVGRLVWESTPGRQYQLETSNDALAWTPWGMTISATTSNTTSSVLLPPALKFYRVFRVPGG